MPRPHANSNLPPFLIRQVRKIVGDMYVSVDEDRTIREEYQRASSSGLAQ